MNVVLLKEWKSGDDAYEAGTTLDCDEMTATELIADELAIEEKDWTPPEVKKNRPNVSIVKDNREDDPRSGYHHIGEFMSDIVPAAKGHISERLAKSQQLIKAGAGGQLESTDSLGGFLVPTEFRSELLRKSHDDGVILSRVLQVPLATNSIEWPAVTESSRATGSRFGGITAYRRTDAVTAAMTPTKATFENIMLKLKDLYIMVRISNDLIEDNAIAMSQYIQDIAPRELRFVTENEIFRGGGAGECLGILSAPCLVSVTRNTTGNIRAVDCITMYSRMFAQSLSNAVWLVNQDCLPDLAEMTLDNKGGTPTLQGAPLWLRDFQLEGAPFGTILGRPLFFVEYASTLGTVGDILFVDLNQYLYATKSSGIRADASMHVQFDYDEMAYRFILRNDGQPWWSKALTPFKGSNTQSPFIALAT